MALALTVQAVAGEPCTPALQDGSKGEERRWLWVPSGLGTGGMAGEEALQGVAQQNFLLVISVHLPQDTHVNRTAQVIGKPS